MSASKEWRTQVLVQQIDALAGDDPEVDHSTVDKMLIEHAGPEVKAAVDRLEARAGWWAAA